MMIEDTQKLIAWLRSRSYVFNEGILDSYQAWLDHPERMSTELRELFEDFQRGNNLKHDRLPLLHRFFV